MSGWCRPQTVVPFLFQKLSPLYKVFFQDEFLLGKRSFSVSYAKIQMSRATWMRSHSVWVVSWSAASYHHQKNQTCRNLMSNDHNTEIPTEIPILKSPTKKQRKIYTQHKIQFFFQDYHFRGSLVV